jgi:sugar phosphate isomerase/epimerase
MTQMNRRSFLASSLLVCAENVLGQSTRAPHFVFPVDPRHRIAIATYPFRAAIEAPGNKDRVASVPGMDLASFAHYVRTEFNVFGIEPLHSHFASTERSDVLKLRAVFDAAGVRTMNIPVDEHPDLCSQDEGVRQEGYARYRKWVDVAVILGSPSIRIAVPKCNGPDDADGPAMALGPVVSYAASQGVVVNLENDNPVYANAAHIIKIINKVSSPWFGGLPDFANSLMGGDEQFNSDAVRAMFAHAINIAHVKNGEVIEDKWRAVSLPPLFAIAKQARYRGYYSMESESADVMPVSNTKFLVEQSVALM